MQQGGLSGYRDASPLIVTDSRKKCEEEHTSICADYDRSGPWWKLEGNIGKRGYVIRAVVVGQAIYCDRVLDRGVGHNCGTAGLFKFIKLSLQALERSHG